MGKKTKKTTTNNEMKKKPSNRTSTTPHLSYFQMISEAITTMKDKKGSSQQAISKFIQDKHGSTLPFNFRKFLSIQLRRIAEKGSLIKVKNSYKMVEIKAKKVVKKKKRLSQVKTPETLKKKVVSKLKREKIKPLSQVTTPEALKRKSKSKRKSNK